MRSIQWAVAVVATSGLLGCGGSQPSIYRVAVDRLTAANLPAACYRSGTAPSPIPDQTRNTVDEQQWVYWEGIDGVSYLDVGGVDYALADAVDVTIGGDAIQGEKNDDDEFVFTAERVQTDTDSTVTTSATYTITKLGDTLEGTLRLNSTCAGADCTAEPRTPSCEASVSFVGRRIDVDQLTAYPNSGND